MTKTEQLNALFSEWRENREEYKGQFIKDGIIDETLYNTQKPKLLFIGKEANDGKGKDWDYRDHIMDGVKYKYNLRVAEWAYGIQNNFPAFDNIYRSRETLTESAKKIAIIDVKKNGGKGRCNDLDIKTNIENNREYLLTQINIIKPDVIISGLSNILLVSTLFQGIQFQLSGYVRCVAKWGDYKIIDFYHPSNQNVPAASYLLMKAIYQSEAFKQL